MAAQKDNAVKRLGDFLTESRKEIRKVVWPTRKETTTVTAVCILLVFGFGFYLALVDWVLSEAVKYLIR